LHGHPAEDKTPAPRTTGRVIHWAWRYDLLLWAISLGRESAFRQKQIDLAGIAAGESVLDVGCGTGTLAIAAKRRVGESGVWDRRVAGDDCEGAQESEKGRRRAGVRYGSDRGNTISRCDFRCRLEHSHASPFARPSTPGRYPRDTTGLEA